MKKHTVRDIKPVLKQKFLGDASNKLKENVDDVHRTKRAATSVAEIKMYQIKTQANQTQ